MNLTLLHLIAVVEMSIIYVNFKQISNREFKRVFKTLILH